jgi:DNA-binding transcriptional ArsR family regulator
VLHNPARFGVRAQWAAGVRSRFPAPHRDFLEKTFEFLPIPLLWINRLDIKHKNSFNMLQALETVPAEKRLLLFFHQSQLTDDVMATIERLRSNATSSAADLESLRTIYQRRTVPVRTGALRNLVQAFLSPTDFGESLLAALKTYYQVFFIEEEKRIAPFIEECLVIAKKQTENLSASAAMESLSKGVYFEPAEYVKTVWLMPSYWISPLAVINYPHADEALMAFGCRQKNQNLIPGEYIPEDMVESLKALSDSTRLRILHYLKESPESPASLARKLRLRPPTVVHHLNILRLASMIQILVSDNGERRYCLREDAVHLVISQLNEFIRKDDQNSVE